MPSLQMTNGAGAKQSFDKLQKLDAANVKTATQAALKDHQDNLLVTVGSDLYLASGKFDKGFRPNAVSLDGKVGEIKGVQLEKDEPTTFWRKLKLGMNFPAVQVGAGSALAGMLGGAWVSGNFFGSSMPVMWGISAAMAVVGFFVAALVQGSSGSAIPMPDLTKWVEAKTQK